MQRVLVVEDDPIIALDVSGTIEDEIGIPVVVAFDLMSAANVLAPDIRFALLDINIGKDTSFGLARRLMALGVPFAFTSGFKPGDVPEDLRHTVFLAKPCRPPDIIDTVRSALAA